MTIQGHDAFVHPFPTRYASSGGSSKSRPNASPSTASGAPEASGTAAGTASATTGNDGWPLATRTPTSAVSDDHRAMLDELVVTAPGDDGYEVVAGVDDEPETDEE